MILVCFGRLDLAAGLSDALNYEPGKYLPFLRAFDLNSLLLNVIFYDTTWMIKFHAQLNLT